MRSSSSLCLALIVTSVGIISIAACSDSSPAAADAPINLPDHDAGGSANDAGPITSSDAAGNTDATSSTEAGAPYTDFDVNHILVTGQSNSVANDGSPVLSTKQPYGNVMFNTGVMSMVSPCDDTGCKTYDPPTSFVPLVQGDTYFDYAVETSGNGVADEISMLVTTKYGGLATVPNLPAKHDLLVSVHGRSGNTYWCLRKGGCDYQPGYFNAYAQGMMEVTSAKAIADAAKKTYVVRAVNSIHGESDHANYVTNTSEFPLDGTDGTAGKIKDYSDALLEWQSDYETGVKAITKQTTPVPMFISQISGWNDARTSKVAQYELDAHIRAPGKVILIGASYIFPFSQDDCLHYLSDGERHLGEYFAKVYTRVVIEGKTWEPVRPKTVTRNGATIDVVFYVPVPPLAIDTTLVPLIANNGFDYVIDGGGASPAIANVALTGPDSVRITLASAPAGTGHLTYAQNQTPGTCIGAPSGSRGNLRDSDATPSKYGYQLQNWAVAFDVATP